MLMICRGERHYDKTFADLFRRRMEHEQQRAKYHRSDDWTKTSMVNPYVGVFSLISIFAGFALLIHTFKGR
jgi:hypothetical protein